MKLTFLKSRSFGAKSWSLGHWIVAVMLSIALLDMIRTLFKN